MAKEICVQTIYVSNLPQAVDFYVRALGYEVQERYGDCIVQLRTKGTALVVQELEPGQTVPDRPSSVLSFGTDNILESMAEVLAGGGTLMSEAPQPCPVGVFIGFKDPAGVVHELLQFSPPVP